MLPLARDEKLHDLRTERPGATVGARRRWPPWRSRTEAATLCSGLRRFARNDGSSGLERDALMHMPLLPALGKLAPLLGLQHIGGIFNRLHDAL